MALLAPEEWRERRQVPCAAAHGTGPENVLRCIGCCSAVHRPSQRAVIATAARCAFPGVIVPAMVLHFSFMVLRPYLLPPGRMDGTPHRLPDASPAFLSRMATCLSGMLRSPVSSCVNKSKSQTRWLAKWANSFARCKRCGNFAHYEGLMCILGRHPHVPAPAGAGMGCGVPRGCGRCSTGRHGADRRT